MKNMRLRSANSLFSTVGREFATIMNPHKADAKWPVPIKAYLAGGVLILIVFICWKRTLAAPDAVGWGEYSFSEWLINYQGGFVRRGLPGELIHWLSEGRSAAPITNAWIFLLFISLCGLLLCLIVLSDFVTPLIAVMLILVPGGVYGMVMGNTSYFRKEMLFHVYLAAVATLFLLARRREGSRISHTLDVLTVALIAAGSAILPFMHEAFLFLSAVPSALIIYWLARRWSDRTARSVALAYLALSTAQFIILILHKGDDAIANAIWASIHPADQVMISSASAIWIGGQLLPRGAIDFLPMTILQNLLLQLRTVVSGYAWYWVFAIAASAAYLVATSFAYQRKGSDYVNRQAGWVFTVYVICLAGAIPLFVIAYDWGRWIAAINLSVVMLMCAGECNRELPAPVMEVLKPRPAYSRGLAYSTLAFAIIFGLSFMLPEHTIIGVPSQGLHNVWYLMFPRK
jgi:hypothetical protein